MVLLANSEDPDQTQADLGLLSAYAQRHVNALHDPYCNYSLMTEGLVLVVNH